MKQIYFQQQAKSQTQQGIKDANAQTCQGMLALKSKINADPIIPLPKGQGAELNIFLIQNKGKGPPGRTRSPGMADWPNPGQSVGCVEQQTMNNKIQLNKFLNPNRLTQLNFYIMKKQLFILILALFAVNLAWAQPYATNDTKAPGPQPFTGTCSDDALHPIPGKAYTYEVTSPASSKFTWWATKDNNFISTTATGTTTNIGTALSVPGALLSTTTNYAQVGAGSNSVGITWTPQILALTSSATVTGKSPTFVAVLAEDATGCTNNFKVYKIDPKVAFTVDILNLTDDTRLPIGSGQAAYTASETQCFSEVASATYNATNGGVDYNYGTNILYYEVIAANFTTAYSPSFQVSGLLTGQTATLEWTVTDPSTGSPTWTAIGSTINGDATGTAQTVGTTSVTVSATENTSLGVSIYLRLTVNNGNYEGLIAQNVAVAVEGTDNEGNKDLDQASATCLPNATGYEDKATQVLTERPTVTTNTPTTGPLPFLPKN